MSDKTYTNDDRRKKAALDACDGFPTEWLERGIVAALYRLAAFLALADKLGERGETTISFPVGWWDAHARGHIEALNNIAEKNRVQ